MGVVGVFNGNWRSNDFKNQDITPIVEDPAVKFTGKIAFLVMQAQINLKQSRSKKYKAQCAACNLAIRFSREALAMIKSESAHTEDVDAHIEQIGTHQYYHTPEQTVAMRFAETFDFDSIVEITY